MGYKDKNFIHTLFDPIKNVWINIFCIPNILPSFLPLSWQTIQNTIQDLLINFDAIMVSINTYKLLKSQKKNSGILGAAN